MASRRSVLGGSALSIVTFLVLYTKKTKMVRTDTIDGLWLAFSHYNAQTEAILLGAGSMALFGFRPTIDKVRVMGASEHGTIRI